MIQNVLFLAGGLGNQLFQVAFAIDRYGLGNFKIDWSQRHPRSSNLEVPSIIQVIPSLEGYLVSRKHDTRLLSLMYRLSFATFQNSHREGVFFRGLFKCPSQIILKIYYGRRYRQRVSFIHDTNALHDLRAKSEVCVGYFQSSRFINNLGLENFPVVHPNLSQKGSDLLKLFDEINPVVVHVRLGDYINNPAMGILGCTYYEKAFEFVSQRVLNPMWVFTDSEEIVRGYLPNSYLERLEIVNSQDLSPGELLTCMRKGAFYVISNSTLAWWAAYLRDNSEAPVIGPEQWFNSVVYSEELLPQDWIRVANDFR